MAMTSDELMHASSRTILVCNTRHAQGATVYCHLPRGHRGLTIKVAIPKQGRRSN
jgi:hypothetical protein